jgi:hypothetical protein
VRQIKSLVHHRCQFIIKGQLEPVATSFLSYFYQWVLGFFWVLVDCCSFNCSNHREFL